MKDNKILLWVIVFIVLISSAFAFDLNPDSGIVQQDDFYRQNISTSEPWNNLTAYYSFDGDRLTTATDWSGNGNDGTYTGYTFNHGVNNGVAINQTEGVFDGSIGGSDITISDTNDEISNITEEMSISLWFKQDGASSDTYSALFFKVGKFGCFQNNLENRIKCSIYNGSAHNVYSSIGIYDNTWHNLILLFNGTTVLLYEDGDLEDSTPMGGDISITSNTFYIGNYDGNSNPFNGSIKNTQIYNRALSQTEVSQIYNNTQGDNYYTPVSDGLVAQYIFKNNSQNINSTHVYDSNNLVQGYNSSVSYTGGKFDGVDDYVSFTQNLSNKPFSISTWFKYVGIDDNNRYTIVSIGEDGAYDNYINFRIGRTDEQDGLNVIIGNNTDISLESNTNVKDGLWHNGIVTKNNNNISLYLDGIFLSSTTNDVISTVIIDTYGKIGKVVTAGIFNGSIDEVMIFNKALNSTEISDIYTAQATKYQTGWIRSDFLSSFGQNKINITNQDFNIIATSSLQVRLNYTTDNFITYHQTAWQDVTYTNEFDLGRYDATWYKVEYRLPNTYTTPFFYNVTGETSTTDNPVTYYYIDIVADDVDTSKLNDYGNITRISYNTWRLNASTGNIETDRATLVRELFYENYNYHNETFTNLQEIRVSLPDDLIKRGIYSRAYMSTNGPVTGPWDKKTEINISFINPQYINNCSIWWYEAQYTGTSSSSFEYWVKVNDNYVGSPTVAQDYYLNNTRNNDTSNTINMSLKSRIYTPAETNKVGYADTRLTSFCQSPINYSMMSQEPFGTSASWVTDYVVHDFTANSTSYPLTSYAHMTVQFYNQLPYNNTAINNTQLLEYAIDNVNGVADCSLYNNNILVETVTGLTTGTQQFSFNSSYWSDGINNLNITCTDDIYTEDDIKSLFVDAIEPVINYINYSFDSTQQELNNSVISVSNITVYTSTTDNNNYLFNITCWDNATNTIFYSNQTTGITETYNWNGTVYLSGLSTGLHYCNVTSADSHTKKELDFKKELIQKDIKEKKYIGKKIDDKVSLKSDNNYISSFDLIEKSDRKNFDIKFNKGVTFFKMYVEGQNKVEYLKDSKYPAHFVIDNKYWYDLKNDKGVKVITVTKINDTYYEILLQKDKNIDQVLFDSVGLINSLTQTVQFDFYTLNISIFDEITNILIPNTTLEFISDLYSLSYTSTTGSDISFLPFTTYDVRYIADGYDERNYYFDHVATDTTLNLYLLNTTTTESCSATIYNELGLIQEGVLLESYKYDLASNSFLLVESKLTNFEGKLSLLIDVNQEYYKFKMYYPPGTLRETTTQTYIYSCPLNFQINTESEVTQDMFNKLEIVSNITFSNATNQFTLTYNDPNSLASLYCLDIYQNINGNESLFSTECVTSSAGTLIKAVTVEEGYGYTAKFLIYDNDFELIDSLYYLYGDSANVFKTSNMSLFLVLFITLILIMSAQKFTLSVILAPIPMLLASVFRLVNISWQYSAGVMLLAIIIAYVIGGDK